MDSLVERLSKGDFEIQANRPHTSSKNLKERIDLNYVHVLFKETGTELGVTLDLSKCRLSDADFEKGIGDVHIEGVLTLNYEKVKCVADISVVDCSGRGHLLPVSDQEYNAIISSSK